MKTINLKTIYRFEGYVAVELRAQEWGAQIKLDFDKRSGPRCPHCNCRLPKNKASTGCAMDLPIADATVVYIIYPRIQGRCQNCDHFVTTRPKELHPRREATWRLMRAVSSWASAAPARVVAAMFEISDSTVRRYDYEVLEASLPEPQLDGIRSILIDEKHLGRRHGYVTIVLNGDTGELLSMEKGKKKASLECFFQNLSEQQRGSIQVVGIDRAGAYQSAVQKWLPAAAIVYDRFHLMMNLNQAVDDTRRAEWRGADKSKKKLIKSSRYLLLSNPENLKESAKERLQALRQANEVLSTAYQLREQFRMIYHYKSQTWASKALSNWCDLAEASGLAAFARLAKGFRKSSDRITSYIKYRLTSGRIEGFNSKLARIIHRSCGINNLSYLFLKLQHESIMHI